MAWPALKVLARFPFCSRRLSSVSCRRSFSLKRAPIAESTLFPLMHRLYPSIPSKETLVASNSFDSLSYILSLVKLLDKS